MVGSIQQLIPNFVGRSVWRELQEVHASGSSGQSIGCSWVQHAPSHLNAQRGLQVAEAQQRRPAAGCDEFEQLALI